MAKPGQPTKYNPEFHPKDYLRLSKMGKNKTQIACIWDIDKDSIYEWARKHPKFSVAVKRGESLLEHWYTEIGQAAIMGKALVNGQSVDLKGFNLGAFVWMTKNVLKWHDRVENKVEHSGEVKSKMDRKLALKKVFKTQKSRQLALELAEQMCEEEDKQGEANGKDSDKSVPQG